MSKILLVEDDKALREIYGIRLRAEGYEIVEAPDGEAGLTQAVAVAPDLIISDAMMPKISGFEMLDLLKGNEKTKGIKVIMMTALSSDSQRERGEKLGADLYLVKSQVGIEDLVRAVHYILRDRPINATTTAPAPVSIPVPNATAASASAVPSTPAMPVAAPKVASIPPQPMRVPTIMDPVNPTARTQAAPEIQGIAATPIVPIDPVARVTSPTIPAQNIQQAQQFQRLLAPVPIPVPTSIATTPQTNQPMAAPQPIPQQQPTQFIGQNPAINRQNLPLQQQAAPDSDSDAPLTTSQYTIGGPGGMDRVIQPIDDTLHPKVDIDALLASDAAANSTPVNPPVPQTPSIQVPNVASNETLKFD